jgi:REP element-mobilizing transposase RayT
MPRISRQDEPGRWHHVFNRAIARRTLFERREDYRFFLAMLARAVRRGEIEVHAYCLMGTHYHLLLRSPEGRMADAMQRVQLAYSRWFNRSRRRDGSLVRGRYGSKPVRSLRYRQVLLRYIDLNPCSARLAETPSMYAWGSARHYSWPTGPPWLERRWVEAEVASEGGSEHFRPERYDETLSVRRPAELRQLVEARMTHGDGEDPLDDIVSAANPATRHWMVRKAILADGTRPGLPLLSSSRLERIIEEGRHKPWIVTRGQSDRDGWSVAHVGLGRDLCGQTLRNLAHRLGVSETKVRRLYATHRAELDEETGYSLRVVELAGGELGQWAKTEFGGGCGVRR